MACKAYGQVVDKVVPVSSARVAEAAKLLENIYRCVNIAMINELKLLFERMDIDAWEVISAAATKPFGFTPVLSRSRPGRSLYPDRSVLSDLEGAPVQFLDPLHSVGRRDQYRDAVARGRAGRARTQPQGQGAQRRERF